MIAPDTCEERELTHYFLHFFNLLFFIGVQGCLDSNGELHAVGTDWKPSPCTNCFCYENSFPICSENYCGPAPAHCTLDPIQNPEDCCPSYTCPEGKNSMDFFQITSQIQSQSI